MKCAPFIALFRVIQLKIMSKVLRIVCIIVCLAHICNSFRWSSPVVRQSVASPRVLTLYATPSIGDHFKARLDDVVGSVRDSVAIFSLTNDGQVYKARMPTKRLTLQERMSLKVGETLSVCVTKNDGPQLEVLLSTHQPVKNPYVTPPTNRKMLVGKLGTPEPTKDEYFMMNGLDETSVPNGGLLLNNLKTGTRLEGEVIQSTEYGAFIDCNIYRKAKGRVLQRIHGILHKSEIAPSVLKKYGKLYDDPHDRYKIRTGRLILDVGTRITVYVKHVFKNQGRISFTTDPTITKAKLVKEVQANRQTGNIRRAGRRLRRELENVELGDLVHGVVDKVVPQGVLVTITSVGPINATGLIGDRFLPRQYQLPPNVNPEYRLHLLGKEFTKGRPVICSVHKKNEHSNADMMYSMKLMLEEIGPTPKEGLGLEDEEDREAATATLDGMFKKRFRELVRAKRFQRDLETSLPKIRDGSKNGDDSDEESMDEGPYDDDDDDDDEEFGEFGGRGDNADSADEEEEDGEYDDEEDPGESERERASHEQEDESEDDSDDKISQFKKEQEQEDNLATESDFRRIYQDLRAGKEVAQVGDVYEWSEVKDVLAEGLLKEIDFKNSLHSVGVPVYEEGLTAPVRLKQFLDFTNVIQHKIYHKEEARAKLSDPAYQAKREKAKQHIRDLANQHFSRFRKFGVEKVEEEHADEIVAEMDENKWGPPPSPFWVDDSLPADEDDEYTAALKLQYRELRGGERTLTNKRFREWTDIQDLLTRKAIKPAHLHACMLGAQKNFHKKGFTFREFEELVSLIDQAAQSDDPDWEKIERENNVLNDPNFVPQYLPDPPAVAAPKDAKSGDAESVALGDGTASGSPTAVAGNVEGGQTAGLLSQVQALSDEEDRQFARDATAAAGAAPTTFEGKSNLQLYQELTRGDPLLNLLNFKTWLPIQRLIETEQLSSEGLDNLIDVVLGDGAAKNSRISKVDPVQFDRMVNILKRKFPDLLKYIEPEPETASESVTEGKFDSDDDEDEYDDEDQDSEYSDNGEDGEYDEEQDDGLIDDEEVMETLYDDLRGRERQLLVSQFKQWGDIAEMKEESGLTYQALDKLINEIVAPTAAHAQGATITREQFRRLVERLDDKYGLPTKSMHQARAEAEVNLMQDKHAGLTSELLERVRGEQLNVTVRQLRQSKEILALLGGNATSNDQETSQQALDTMLKEVLGSPVAAANPDTVVSLEQFGELIGMCMERSAASLTKEDEEKFWLDTYAAMKTTSLAGAVTVFDVMNSSFVRSLLSSDYMSAEAFDVLFAVALGMPPAKLQRSNGEKVPVSYDQFRLMVFLVDNPEEIEKLLRRMKNSGVDIRTVRQLKEQASGKGAAAPATAGGGNGSDDDDSDDDDEEEEEEEEDSEDEYNEEEVLSSLYEEMKEQFGGEASVKSFLKSEFIVHAMREAQLTRNQVSEAVDKVMGAGASSSRGTIKMSQEQYVQIMRLLDVSNEEEQEE